MSYHSAGRRAAKSSKYLGGRERVEERAILTSRTTAKNFDRVAFDRYSRKYNSEMDIAEQHGAVRVIMKDGVRLDSVTAAESPIVQDLDPK